MNILFDAEIMNGTFVGIAKSLYYLYSNCHRMDNSFHAFGFNSNQEMEYHRDGITLIGRKDRRELEAFAKEKRISIVHYPANFITRPILSGLKIVLTLHDLIPYEEKDTFPRLLQRIKYLAITYYGLRKADLVTTVSEYSRQSIMAFSGSTVSPLVLHWGVTLPGAYSKERVIDDNYFLYVGGYDKRKGIDRLVGAFLEMKRRGLTGCKLVLTGQPRLLNDGTDETIRAGVKEGHIIQTGYVDDEKLCSLYANAVCAVYLSKSEGFGLPLIEAMKCGCPVITTEKTSLPEIGGNAACYVDRDSRDQIIQSLIRMERDSAFRNACIQSGTANLARFDWDVSANRFLDALRRLADK